MCNLTRLCVVFTLHQLVLTAIANCTWKTSEKIVRTTVSFVLLPVTFSHAQRQNEINEFARRNAVSTRTTYGCMGNGHAFESCVAQCKLRGSMRPFYGFRNIDSTPLSVSHSHKPPRCAQHEISIFPTSSALLFLSFRCSLFTEHQFFGELTQNTKIFPIPIDYWSISIRTCALFHFVLCFPRAQPIMQLFDSNI